MQDFFFEAVVTVNLTAMLVLTTMFISGMFGSLHAIVINNILVSSNLPTTSYIKMVDIWLIFNLFLPFLEVLLHTYMDSLRFARSLTLSAVHHCDNNSWTEMKRTGK